MVAGEDAGPVESPGRGRSATATWAGRRCRGWLQLKKSVQGIRNEIESVAFDAKHTIARSLEKAEESAREEATTPKFEPPPAEPVAGGSEAEGRGSFGGPPADNS